MRDDPKTVEIEFLSRKILELNKQLIESESAKTAFLSLIANELNNPMTVLLGMIPHLAPPIGDPKEGIYEILHEEALNLEFRIQNLVAASKIESGTCDIAYAQVNVETLLDEALESLKYLIRNQKILLVIENNIKAPIVSDPYRLYLILKNVLSNACKYGEKKGIIEVILTQYGEQIAIHIKNQGKGPQVDFKPQVFTRFAHGPDGFHGLGLGLSVVRHMCESLSGSVDYTSENGVVTFSIVFPTMTKLADSSACGSRGFLFESFDDVIEL